MIIHFDICAIIIYLVLIFTVFFRKMTKGTPQRVFLNLLFICLFSTIFDVISVIFDGSTQPTRKLLASVSTYCYIVLRNSTVLFYILYIISLTDDLKEMQESFIKRFLLITPFCFVMLCMVANPFTSYFFYYDADGFYHRGPLMSLFYFVTAFYIIFCLAYVIKHRNYYSREKFMALTALLPINSAAIIVQMIWSDYLVESFFMAIGCLLIIITIQRPEEIIDALTGLKNFPTYLGELQQVYNSKAEVSFICINVANLPRLTNIFSPESLQEFMSLVTDKIQQANKKTKVRAELYYIGNGCFRAFLREYSPKKALRFAYDVNASLKEPFVFNGMDFNLIAYVCYGSIPDDVETYDDFMSFGRYFHKVIPYSGEVLTLAEILKDNQFEIRKNLNTIIDNAFANKSFEVYYQPIYSLKEKRFTTAEALLRLKDETYGFISPELFIPMAEKNGSIHKIGDFVMEEVCRFIGSEEFKELGLSYIEVNLSVAQCISPHLADNICSVMEQYKVSPHQINLEITETAAAYNQTAMLQNIDDLKRAGLTFSLDDYGMGYSNIESFSSLPLKIVKLDKNFISWVDQPHMKIVLTHTVQMLEELDLQIVIEGVETEQMLQYFSSLGCDYIQGYYFSKPLPKKDFVSFIKNHLGGLSHEEFSMG